MGPTSPHGEVVVLLPLSRMPNPPEKDLPWPVMWQASSPIFPFFPSAIWWYFPKEFIRFRGYSTVYQGA